MLVRCPDCGGKGAELRRGEEVVCSRCDGEGYVESAVGEPLELEWEADPEGED